MWKSLFTIPFLLILAACAKDGASDSSTTTYSISGTLDAGATASSLSTTRAGWDVDSTIFGLRAKTACDDGQFYSVFCMTFTSPPTAAEGDVSCSGSSGSFTVQGLPLGEPIYCVVRRYASADATTGSNVGAIEIPTANLSGSSDTIVGNGNLTMAVTMNSTGKITATVTGSQGSSSNSTAENFFTPSNVNGDWTLTCDNNNGGSQFKAGACKCFLGESFYSEGGYSNQDDCLNDSNGPGAGITSTVSLGINMNIYPVTTTADLPMDNNVTIPSGTAMKAISIWAQGTKTGGEGITNLGGKLNWDTTPQDPQTAITWTVGNKTVKDGSNADIAVNIPALNADPNTMDHQDWVTWAQSVANAAEANNFDCTWGPTSNASTNDTNLNQNVECINQVLEALTREDVGATVPRIRLQAYCDNVGCDITDDGANSGDASIYDANTFQHVRVEFEDWHLAYPNTWAETDNYTKAGSDVNPDSDGLGVSPKTRFVFEPLQITPTGAGFRQGHQDQRHYNCVSGAAGQGQVQNSACTGNYWELVCYSSEQLAIKFIGSSSPMDVIFDSLRSPVAARLIEHTANGPEERVPNGTNVIAMCQAAAGVSGFTFFATGTKN